MMKIEAYEKGLADTKNALKSDLSRISCLKEQIAASDELDEVIGKLSAAALQISPKDDQIIAGHIRDSVALLLRHRHKLRERAAP
jgi:hypothetical protein